MSKIPLHEFRELIDISDRSILFLLERNLLPIEISDKSGITINMERLSTEELAQQIADFNLANDFTEDDILLVEKISRMIRSRLDRMLDLALSKLSHG